MEVELKTNRNPGGKEGLKTINEVRKHIIILERHQNEEIRRKEKNEDSKKEYFIKKNGIRTVTQELKQRLYAKNSKAEEI